MRDMSRGYRSVVYLSKIYQPLPKHQLELRVEPKLAYTSTSSRGCKALAARWMSMLLVRSTPWAQLWI
jgi:hypothetical protein